MKRRWCTLASALILALMTGCGDDGGDTTRGQGRTSFDSGSEVSSGSGNAHTVTGVIERAGLDVCNPVETTDFSGSYERKLYDIFLGICSPDKTSDGTLLIETFSNPELLAQAASSEAPDGLIGYEWKQFLVSVQPGTRPEAITLFREAMNKLEGAGLAFDRS